MPRAGATYALPNSPVVTGTVISSNHYNTTLTDIAEALSNSVSRDGSGTMTGPLRGVNGSSAIPMYSFGSDTNTGVYRAGADQLGIAAGGVASAIFTPSQAQFVGGTFLLPSLTSQTDPTTGFTFTGSGTASFVASAEEALGFINIGASKIAYLGTGFSFRAQLGSTATPGLSFLADPDTGLQGSGANAVYFISGAAIVAQWGTDGLSQYLNSAAYRVLDVGRSGISGVVYINDADRTLLISDVNKLIYGNATTANRTITIPTNASVAFPIGTKIQFGLYNGGSGFDWRILASGGVTLSWVAYNDPTAAVVFGTGVGADVGYGDWIHGELHKVGTDSWFFTGMAQGGL